MVLPQQITGKENIPKYEKCSDNFNFYDSAHLLTLYYLKFKFIPPKKINKKQQQQTNMSYHSSEHYFVLR